MDDQKVRRFWLRRAADRTSDYLWDGKARRKFRAACAHMPVRCRKVLDLGAGDCAISVALALERGVQVTAIDYASAPRVLHHPNVTFISGDVRTARYPEGHQMGLLFGLMQFMSDADAVRVYEKCRDSVERRIVVISHCARRRRKVVDGYSEALKSHYISIYRTIEEESNLAEKAGWKATSVYGLGGNYDKWPDTYNQAFVFRRAP